MANRAAQGIHRLFVSNITWTVSHRELFDYFSQFGIVETAKVVFDRSSGMSRGYGFIEYSSKNGVENVINKKDHLLEGSFMNVQPSSS